MSTSPCKHLLQPLGSVPNEALGAGHSHSEEASLASYVAAERAADQRPELVSRLFTNQAQQAAMCTLRASCKR